MAGRPSKVTPELARQILAELRRGGRLVTAASLAGIGKSTLFEWLRRGEMESSGPYYAFVREVTSIGEERLTTLSLRYYKVIVGCVMQMPVRDGEGRPRYDAGGQQVFSERVLRPKRRELERELVRLYPHDYNRKTDPWANRTVAEEQFPDDGLELTENVQGDIGTLDEHGVQHNYADSLGKSPTQPESGSNRGRAMGRPHKLTPELSARILG
jgi:hypothetical protein